MLDFHRMSLNQGMSYCLLSDKYTIPAFSKIRAGIVECGSYEDLSNKVFIINNLISKIVTTS